MRAIAIQAGAGMSEIKCDGLGEYVDEPLSPERGDDLDLDAYEAAYRGHGANHSANKLIRALRAAHAAIEGVRSAYQAIRAQQVHHQTLADTEGIGGRANDRALAHAYRISANTIESALLEAGASVAEPQKGTPT